MINKKELSAKDLLLVLLYCPGINGKKNEPITGRTKLTKMIYLFEKEVYSRFFEEICISMPKFEPYHYGPFSKNLFDDLRFFVSIGLIKKEETLVPISTASKYEQNIDSDEGCDDEWSNAILNNADVDDVELRYFLSDKGTKYVEDNIWDLFSQTQKDNLIRFKKQINAISLDSLLNYVYNKYPEDTINSYISEKYLRKESKK